MFLKFLFILMVNLTTLMELLNLFSPTERHFLFTCYITAFTSAPPPHLKLPINHLKNHLIDPTTSPLLHPPPFCSLSHSGNCDQTCRTVFTASHLPSQAPRPEDRMEWDVLGVFLFGCFVDNKTHCFHFICTLAKFLSPRWTSYFGKKNTHWKLKCMYRSNPKWISELLTL